MGGAAAVPPRPGNADAPDSFPESSSLESVGPSRRTAPETFEAAPGRDGSLRRPDRANGPGPRLPPPKPTVPARTTCPPGRPNVSLRTRISVSARSADSESPRDGRFLEKLGTYNPLQNPAQVELNTDRVKYWIDQGATPTDTVRSILKREGVFAAAE